MRKENLEITSLSKSRETNQSLSNKESFPQIILS